MVILSKLGLVIAMDRPLLAIAKQIHWEKAALYGEEKYVVMMGGWPVCRNGLVENDWALVGRG